MRKGPQGASRKEYKLNSSGWCKTLAEEGGRETQNQSRVVVGVAVMTQAAIR